MRTLNQKKKLFNSANKKAKTFRCQSLGVDKQLSIKIEKEREKEMTKNSTFFFLFFAWLRFFNILFSDEFRHRTFSV